MDVLVSDHCDGQTVVVEGSGRMAQSHLRKVARAKEKLELARLELEQAVLAAQDSGESLRDIAPWAGMTYTRLHELTRRARARDS